VPKDGSNGVERRTRTQHVGGSGVAEKASTARGSISDPGPLEPPPDDARYVAQRPKGRKRPQKDPAVPGIWPAPRHVVEQGIASILWKRQANLSAALATDLYCSLLPGNVIETHGENITGPKTETRQKEQDRLLANAAWRRGITGGDQPFDIGHR
jgi:hypothetical protein